MSVDHFFENRNLYIQGTSQKITLVSRQGTYEGINMRVPPPEFEALLFFMAIDFAHQAEIIKKTITTSKGNDGIEQIECNDENNGKFFSMCQNAIAAHIFASNAMESWANKSIIMYGLKEGKPIEVTIKNLKGEVKKIKSNQKDIKDVVIKPKLFQCIPQIFKIDPLREHSTIKKNLSAIIDERNDIVHMQETLDKMNIARYVYTIKLFKASSLKTIEDVLKYMNYVYDKSSIKKEEWIIKANKDLKRIKKKIK